MLMPDVHSCAQVLSENEKLKKYLKKIKRENNDLKQEIAKYQEEKRVQTLMREYVTTRSMEVQTDAVRGPSVFHPPKPKPDKQDTTDRLNKMMTLHNNLMKRYEKELRVNMENVDTIAMLNLKVNELEQKVKDSNFQRERLEREKKRRCWGANANNMNDLSDSDPNISGLLSELNKVRKERDKFSKENKRLKQELQGLDQGFFDEIEDIKFSLRQSMALNKEYEKSLRKLCKRFGVPYPNPEKIVTPR